MNKIELENIRVKMTEALQYEDKVQIIMEGLNELLSVSSKLRNVLGATPISNELETTRMKLMSGLGLVGGGFCFSEETIKIKRDDFIFASENITGEKDIVGSVSSLHGDRFSIASYNTKEGFNPNETLVDVDKCRLATKEEIASYWEAWKRQPESWADTI